MGTCHYLIRASDRALFDLGTCQPPNAWERNRPFSLPAHPDLVLLITSTFAPMEYAPETIAEVARRLLEFGQGGLMLLANDACDDFDSSRDSQDKLRIVNSRHPADWQTARTQA